MRRQWLRIAALGVFAAVAVVGMSGSSQAGYKSAQTGGGCYKYTDGRGVCSFEPGGVRNDPSTDNWVSLNLTGSSGLPGSFTPAGYFSAQINGVYYSCNVPAGPLLDRWPSTMTAGQWTQVDWDASGRCLDFIMSNGSMDIRY